MAPAELLLPKRSPWQRLPAFISFPRFLFSHVRLIQYVFSEAPKITKVPAFSET